MKTAWATIGLEVKTFAMSITAIPLALADKLMVTLGTLQVSVVVTVNVVEFGRPVHA
jgi:hypothetical protein